LREIRILNQTNTSLLFVYNADSGLWNGALDVMHKVFSPNTYACNLCGITYGALSVKKEWAEFIKMLPLITEFLHRDEWLKEFKREDDLPAVFIQNGDEVRSFISAEEMNKLSLKELKSRVLERVSSIQ
jgi:hypothetical protein